jgi:hypothetical protein
VKIQLESAKRVLSTDLLARLEIRSCRVRGRHRKADCRLRLLHDLCRVRTLRHIKSRMWLCQALKSCDSLHHLTSEYRYRQKIKNGHPILKRPSNKMSDRAVSARIEFEQKMLLQPIILFEKAVKF